MGEGRRLLVGASKIVRRGSSVSPSPEGVGIERKW
jgi:hypothetical protein